MRGTSSRTHEREVKTRAPGVRPANRGSRHWARGLFGLLVALCLVRLAAADEEISILERYPGRLVTVGDHRLHLHCVGEGAPTVVFESGIGGFSIEWRALQARLALAQRVCAYDRAGYGWSDFVATARDAATSADELHALLTNANEPGPYLLVGHSYGGFILRWFARRHEDQVAGLVLLDSSSPEQFERLPAGALPDVPAGAPRRALHMPRLPDGFPVGEGTTALALMMLPKAQLATLAELRGFAASGRALAAAPALRLRVPLLVLSRGRAVFDAAAGGAVSEAEWRRLQSGLMRISFHAAQWVARGAGHLVHLDRPDLVARAVNTLAMPVNAAVDGRGLRGVAFAAVLMSPPP